MLENGQPLQPRQRERVYAAARTVLAEKGSTFRPERLPRALRHALELERASERPRFTVRTLSTGMVQIEEVEE
jgi:hypothetical protein